MKLGVDIDRYENLGMYISMMEKQKGINYERTTQELQMFVLKLKEIADVCIEIEREYTI